MFAVRSKFTNMLYFSFAGVIVSCGMEEVFISYHMYVANLDFQTIDPYTACFGLRLS